MKEPGQAERLLTDALRAVAEQDAGRGASPAVEARVLAEVRSIAQARRRAYAKTWAVAAVLMIAVSIPVWYVVVQSRVGPTPAAEPLTGGGPVEEATEFFPLL